MKKVAELDYILETLEHDQKIFTTILEKTKAILKSKQGLSKQQERLEAL